MENFSKKDPVTCLMNIPKKFYPEIAAGGFSRVDGIIEFYTRVNALLKSDMKILDFGAGRGRGIIDDPVPYRRALRTLKGKCQKVIGLDIDEAVRENPGVDEAHVVAPGKPIPVPHNSIDLILSDASLEHVRDPGFVAGELDRVLKPGGWICARTPNRWGYVAMGATLIPERWHPRLLRVLQPHRKIIDVFPSYYRLNTLRSLKRYFPPARYRHFTYGYFSEPAYFGRSRLLWTLMLTFFRFAPSALAPMWFVFLRKRTR